VTEPKKETPAIQSSASVQFIEAFNSRFRAECLNAHWFLTLDDAKAKVEVEIGANTTMKNGRIGRSATRRRLHRDGAGKI